MSLSNRFILQGLSCLLEEAILWFELYLLDSPFVC